MFSSSLYPSFFAASTNFVVFKNAIWTENCCRRENNILVQNRYYWNVILRVNRYFCNTRESISQPLSDNPLFGDTRLDFIGLPFRLSHPWAGGLCSQIREFQLPVPLFLRIRTAAANKRRNDMQKTRLAGKQTRRIPNKRDKKSIQDTQSWRDLGFRILNSEIRFYA